MTDNQKPELPAAYHLVEVDRIPCLRSYAADLAVQGSDEGTIIHATSLSSASGYNTKSWIGEEGNLHGAIILRPEFSVSEYNQLLFVGLVSLGNSLATELAPMTALSYGWPNDLYIAGFKVASVWVDYNKDITNPWLTVTCSVNVKTSPSRLSGEAISIYESEGTCDLTNIDLLEGWSKQFISVINTWSEKGFPHILALWKLRAEYIKVITEDEVDRHATAILDNGDLSLITLQDQKKIVSLNEWIS